METVFVRNWKSVAVRGVVSMLFGLVAALWLAIDLASLVLLFGAYALVDGLLALASATRQGERTRLPLLVFEALIGIGVGLAVALWTTMTTGALVALIGVWAIVTGLLEIATAVRLRRVVPGELLLGLAGGLSVGFGILMLLGPHASAFVIVALLGCYAFLFGAAILALALRLRRTLPWPPSPRDVSELRDRSRRQRPVRVS